MDNIKIINNNTKDICFETLKILDEDREKIDNTNNYLNNIIDNLSKSKKILENFSSIGNRIVNYLIITPSKEKEIIQNKDEKIIDITNENNTYQQILDIKKLNLIINSELKNQNNKLNEVVIKTKYINNEMNQVSKLFN